MGGHRPPPYSVEDDAVLAAVKAWPGADRGKAMAEQRPALTATARGVTRSGRSGRRNGLWSNKEIANRRKARDVGFSSRARAFGLIKRDLVAPSTACRGQRPCWRR